MSDLIKFKMTDEIDPKVIQIPASAFFVRWKKPHSVVLYVWFENYYNNVKGRYSLKQLGELNDRDRIFASVVINASASAGPEIKWYSEADVKAYLNADADNGGWIIQDVELIVTRHKL